MMSEYTLSETDNVLLQLGKNLPGVFIASKPIHDFKFRKLDVYGIVVLAEENFNIILEDGGSTLDNQENVSQRHILHFRT